MKEERASANGGGAGLIWSLLILIVLLSVGLAFWVSQREEEERQVEPEVKQQVVKTMTVSPCDMPNRVVVPGKTMPFTDAMLSAETAGRITDILVERGDRIEAGQVVLRIDSRTWSQAVLRAEIELREADKELKRWIELAKTGAVSVSDFDAVQTRKDNADLALAEARTLLSKCAIKSPINGLVEERLVERGEYINEGEPAFRVVDIERLKLTFDVAERDIFVVRTGAKIPFDVTATPCGPFTGVVYYISSAADPRNNAFRIEALVANWRGLLKAGMIADVVLQRAMRRNALVVPLASVMSRKGEHVIFKVNDGHAVRKVVHIEDIIGHEAVLSDGLADGDSVVIEGHRTLVDGMAVTNAVNGKAQP